MAEDLGCWTRNLVVLGSSALPCHSLDLFSVATSSTRVDRMCHVCALLSCISLS